VIGDRPELAVSDGSQGQGAADLVNQSPEQRQWITLWLTDHLKLIASGMSVAKL
jgi:hypothetical protein